MYTKVPKALQKTTTTGSVATTTTTTKSKAPISVSTLSKTVIAELTSSRDLHNLVVDAARDATYCPQDPQPPPRPAPRHGGNQPPTPKPRSGNATNKLFITKPF